MLIHLGNNEFVDLSRVEAIFNLATIDPESRARIVQQLPPDIRLEARAAILCTSGAWLASTISPEALAQRGNHSPFAPAGVLDDTLAASTKVVPQGERRSKV